MQFDEVPRTLLKRWYFTLVGVLLTAIGCVGVAVVVPAQHEATATVALLPPKSGAVEGDNPYLALAGLDQALGIVIRALDAQDVHELVESKWPEASYTLEPDFTTSSPIINVKVLDRDPYASLELTQSLVDLVPTTLIKLQSGLGVPTRAQITSIVIAKDQIPELRRKNQLRAVIAIGTLGLLGTALSVALLDGFLINPQRLDKRRRKAVKQRIHAERPDTVPKDLEISRVQSTEISKIGEPSMPEWNLYFPSPRS
jgi:hypothetical protein